MRIGPTQERLPGGFLKTSLPRDVLCRVHVGTMDLERAALHLPTVQMNVANRSIRLMARISQPRMSLFQRDFGWRPAERFDRNVVQSPEDDSTGGIKADKASGLNPLEMRHTNFWQKRSCNSPTCSSSCKQQDVALRGALD